MQVMSHSNVAEVVLPDHTLEGEERTTFQSVLDRPKRRRPFTFWCVVWSIRPGNDILPRMFCVMCADDLIAKYIIISWAQN